MIGRPTVTERAHEEEDDGSFRFTPPKWVKNLGIGIGKWGPAWILLAAALFGGWKLVDRVITRGEAREDKLINALDSLKVVQETLKSHMGTSERTQLFISTMCGGLAQQADTKAQRIERERACYNEYYAQELKDKILSR